MSSWTPRTNRTGLEYGGSANPYYWDNANNPGASFYYCMANCTTYAFGRILEAGDPAPISGWHNANAWHAYLINGWTVLPYSPHTVMIGDLVEWVGASHVAVIEAADPNLGILYVSDSYYIGDDGTVNSSRTLGGVMGSTLQSVSNWMITNYPGSFFHYGNMYESVGSDPDYILRNPRNNPQVGTFKFIGKKQNRKRRILYV